MDDLIININFNESQKQGKTIIETYSGRIKKIKKKTFSGIIKKIDLMTKADKYNNLSEIEFSKIKDIISNNENNKISKYQYIISEKNFKLLINESIPKKNIYFSDLKGNMNDIENSVNVSRINIEISKNKLIITYKVNNNTYRLSKESCCYSDHTNTYIYDCNKLLIVSKEINTDFFKKVLKNKFIANKHNLVNVEKSLYKKNTYSKFELNVIPKMNIYLTMYDRSMQAEIYFEYDNIEINYDNKKNNIELVDKIIYRNIVVEEKLIDKLRNYGWRKSYKNIYKYNSQKHIRSEIDRIIDEGINVFIDNGKVISSRSANYTFKYGIDWMAIEGDIEINVINYSLYELLDLKSRRSNYVKIGDSILFLPETIVDRVQNNNLIFNKREIGNILEIDNEIGISNIDELKSIVDYKKIKLFLPEYIDKVIRKYQEDGVRWLKYIYTNGFGGCLADDMGLGKTFQVIAFLSDEELNIKSKITLIVVPKALLENWKREILRFNKQIDVTIYYGNNRENLISGIKLRKGIILTTYGVAVNDYNILNSLNIECLILDEVQSIKNSKTKAYMAISRVKSKHVIALSGTPFENNIGEVWAILNISNKGLFNTQERFTKKYSLDNGEIDVNRLRSLIKPYFLRRTKKEVLTELPEKIEQYVYCDMTDKQRELYNIVLKKIKDELSKEVNRYEIKSNSIMLEGLLYLRQICCHPAILKRSININGCDESGKFEIFKINITELINNKKKVVVFSSFTSVLEIMELWIKDNNYKYFYIDGSTKNRQEIVDSFEESEEGIFLISMKAGGVGLNLISAEYAFIYDPWWNEAVENQAQDRIYRIGQKNNVVIKKFITSNSIEEKINELKNKKSKIANSLFKDMNEINKISLNDIKKILYLDKNGE